MRETRAVLKVMQRDVHKMRGIVQVMQGDIHEMKAIIREVQAMQTGHCCRRPVDLATIKKMQDDISMVRATQAEHVGHVHADSRVLVALLSWSSRAAWLLYLFHALVVC